MILNRLQPHTTIIYGLDSKKFQIKTIKARTLLTSKRFDLFAKLYYIVNQRENREKALEVYTKHIKTFNPDLKEPGRSDKNTINDFINSFETLINEFEKKDFNDTISIIPVDSNGVILDGAHRLATLAYFDKSVTIAQFEEVYAKCDFNYVFFRERGLDWDTLDIIAHEMTKWLPNLFVACIWPRVNKLKDRSYIENYITSKYTVSYTKQIHIGLTSLAKFIKLIYQDQDWTTNECAVNDKSLNCYSNARLLTFIFFEGVNNLNSLIDDKSIIRQYIGYGKHSIHITDNSLETSKISELVNSDCGQTLWYNRCIYFDKFAEKIYYFKKVQWLNFKISIATIMSKLKRLL